MSCPLYSRKQHLAQGDKYQSSSGSISPLSHAVIGARWMLKRVQHDGGWVRSASDRLQSQIDRQINPLRILRFNQVDLPRTMPVLQLLFPRNCIRHIIKHLKSNQAIDRTFRRMSGNQIVSVLIKPLKQIRRHADVQRSMGFAREYIDARLFHWSHRRCMDGRWTLKQVQGDGWGTNGRY